MRRGVRWAGIPSELRAWQRRASPLARVAAGVYLALLVDASLYPFSGWRDKGIAPFDYLWAPWPAHALEFDIVINVLGYLPLGVLGVFAFYPRIRGLFAVLLVTGGAGILSAFLEAIQTYLPTRVASNVDLATNFAGAAIGALAAWALTEPVLDRGRLREMRLRWFERDASGGLVVLALWLGALLYPTSLALALGSILKALPTWVPNIVTLLPPWEPTAFEFECAELVASSTFLASAGLILLFLVRNNAPRTRLAAALVAASVLVKTFGCGLTYSPLHPVVWLSRGALFGLLGALGLLIVARWFSRSGCLVLASVFLAIGLLTSNVMPDNPYFGIATHDWERGRLLNFYGLALGLSLSWPFLALWWVAHRAFALRSRQRRPV